MSNRYLLQYFICHYKWKKEKEALGPAGNSYFFDNINNACNIGTVTQFTAMPSNNAIEVNTDPSVVPNLTGTNYEKLCLYVSLKI